jgi:uncharacterized glyoxalase superfamily protein PhnB
MPPGTLIPELAYPDLPAAVDWLTRVFGFRERLRIASHRAQMLIDDSTSLVVVQSGGAPAEITSHSLMVAVPDVDAHFARVQQAGARILAPPATYPFGERQYTALDLSGRRWSFSQSVAIVDPASWGGQLR